jgi:predicted secreted protein
MIQIMVIILRKISLLGTILLLPNILLFGDAATLEFFGFSKDGKYLAFEQYGNQDGSGFPYSEVFFLNVVNNSFVGKPIKHIEMDSEVTLEQTRKKTHNLARSKLQSLGITKDKKVTHAISHPPTDLGANPKNARFTIWNPLTTPGGWTGAGYEITLKEIETSQDCSGYRKGKILELSLTNHSTNRTKVLQKDNKDTKLPESFDCAYAYRIQDVFIYDGKYIAVFLNVLTSGFEGSNVRFRVVTGILN